MNKVAEYIKIAENVKKTYVKGASEFYVTWGIKIPDHVLTEEEVINAFNKVNKIIQSDFMKFKQQKALSSKINLGTSKTLFEGNRIFNSIRLSEEYSEGISLQNIEEIIKKLGFQKDKRI